MEQIAAVLGDGARWRLVELLAERPHSVGELAELTGLRQPQTTKHLQALSRVGSQISVLPAAHLSDTLRDTIRQLEPARVD